MVVPELYKDQFQDLIQKEYDRTLEQIEVLVAVHGKGTETEAEIRSYADFLYDLLRNIE